MRTTLKPMVGLVGTVSPSLWQRLKGNGEDRRPFNNNWDIVTRRDGSQILKPRDRSKYNADGSRR